jgi:hypothetical protein
MGGILSGGSKTNSQTITKYTGISIQTSAQGIPIPLVWGQKRVGPNLIWSGDFLAVPEKGGKKGGGGKGGDGKGAGGVVYDYFTAVMLALCEGPITGIGTVWADKDITSLSSLGLTLFSGTASQAVWAYLATNHPTEALAYAYTAYLANSRYSLGKSPNLPNHNFEIIATQTVAPLGGFLDVNPADVVNDFLTNPQYSIGIAGASIDATSLALYRTYCQAQGLFFSPDITSQEQVSQVLDRWAQLTNSWIFWSGSAIKFVPLGDSPITANGVTYTPNTTPLYDLGYEDLIVDGSGPPLTVTRTDPADAYNHLKLEIKDRSNAYNSAIVEWKDQALVDQFGQVDSPNTQAHEYCDTGIAAIAAQLIGYRGAYIRNTYNFKLGWDVATILEPGDIVTITEPHIGLNKLPVRIKELEEDDKGNWTVSAEEFPGDIGTEKGVQPVQPTVNSTVDYNIAPGSVNPPGIFEPDASLTGGVAQVFLAVSGGPDWGGCIVHLSFDDFATSDNIIGSITNPATQGVLTATLASHADPDLADTLAIDTTESDAVMPTDATNADADAFRTLSWITPSFTTAAPSNGELIAYGAVAAGIGPFDSNLTYLRRGLYGTTIAAHSAGAFFTRVELNRASPPGNTLLIYNLPDQYVGATLYLKFQSFNRFGNALETLAGLPVYTYTPTGVGTGTTPLSINVPFTNALLTADQVMLDYVATVAFDLPATLTGSFGGVSSGGVTTTADTIFQLFKNGTSIGSVKIPAGATLGSSTAIFTFTSTVTFAIGDHFRVLAPHVPDATLKSPFFAFLGSY